MEKLRNKFLGLKDTIWAYNAQKSRCGIREGGYRIEYASTDAYLHEIGHIINGDLNKISLMVKKWFPFISGIIIILAIFTISAFAGIVTYLLLHEVYRGWLWFHELRADYFASYHIGSKDRVDKFSKGEQYTISMTHPPHALRVWYAELVERKGWISPRLRYWFDQYDEDDILLETDVNPLSKDVFIKFLVWDDEEGDYITKDSWEAIREGHIIPNK